MCTRLTMVTILHFIVRKEKHAQLRDIVFTNIINYRNSRPTIPCNNLEFANFHLQAISPGVENSRDKYNIIRNFLLSRPIRKIKNNVVKIFNRKYLINKIQLFKDNIKYILHYRDVANTFL